LEVRVSDAVPPVNADPVMLEEVMANLLENVGRYTPPDAKVLLSAATHDGRVEIRVEDGGPGLPDDAVQKIFEKFYRDPSARSHSGRGTGLGLAVVRGMVEAMGGRVSAGRSDLGGLAVCVNLPAARPPEPERTTALDL
jgi:K+-sensing histidine kinase KdpD